MHVLIIIFSIAIAWGPLVSLADGQENSLKDQILQRPTFGNPGVRLGVLFDYRTMQYLPESLWPESTIKDMKHIIKMPHTHYSWHELGGLETKLNLLQVKAEISLDVMDGQVHVSGSAEYFTKKKKSNNHVAITFKDSRTDRYEELTMEALNTPPNLSDGDGVKERATHFVTAIMYGADAYFTFESEANDEESKQTIYGKLELQVNKFKAFQIEASASVSLNTSTVTTVAQFACHFHGDYSISTIPQTYKEALDMHIEIRKSKNFVPVPMRVWLYPISLVGLDISQMLADIKQSFTNQIFAKFQEIERLEVTLETLKDMKTIQNLRLIDIFTTFRQKLQKFGELLEQFKADFQLKLRRVLPRMRGGDSSAAAELGKILGDINKSWFKTSNLHGWLETKTAQMTVLRKFLSAFNKSTELVTAERRTEIETNFHIRTRVGLRIEVESAIEEDKFLAELGNEIDDWEDEERIRQAQTAPPAAIPVEAKTMGSGVKTVLEQPEMVLTPGTLDEETSEVSGGLTEKIGAGDLDAEAAGEGGSDAQLLQQQKSGLAPGIVDQESQESGGLTGKLAAEEFDAGVEQGGSKPKDLLLENRPGLGANVNGKTSKHGSKVVEQDSIETGSADADSKETLTNDDKDSVESNSDVSKANKTSVMKPKVKTARTKATNKPPPVKANATECAPENWFKRTWKNIWKQCVSNTTLNATREAQSNNTKAFSLANKAGAFNATAKSSITSTNQTGQDSKKKTPEAMRTNKHEDKTKTEQKKGSVKSLDHKSHGNRTDVTPPTPPPRRKEISAKAASKPVESVKPQNKSQQSDVKELPKGAVPPALKVKSLEKREVSADDTETASAPESGSETNSETDSVDKTADDILPDQSSDDELPSLSAKSETETESGYKTADDVLPDQPSDEMLPLVTNLPLAKVTTIPAAKKNASRYVADPLDLWYQNPRIQGKLRNLGERLRNFQQANKPENGSKNPESDQFSFYIFTEILKSKSANFDSRIQMYHGVKFIEDAAQFLLEAPTNVRITEDFWVPEPGEYSIRADKSVTITWDPPAQTLNWDTSQISEAPLTYLVFLSDATEPDPDDPLRQQNSTSNNTSAIAPITVFGKREHKLTFPRKDFIYAVKVQAVSVHGKSPKSLTYYVEYPKPEYCISLNSTTEYYNILSVGPTHALTVNGTDLVLRDPQNLTAELSRFDGKAISKMEGDSNEIRDAIDKNDNSAFLLYENDDRIHKLSYDEGESNVPSPGYCSANPLFPAKLSFVRTSGKSSNDSNTGLVCQRYGTTPVDDVPPKIIEVDYESQKVILNTIFDTKSSDGSSNAIGSFLHRAAMNTGKVANTIDVLYMPLDSTKNTEGPTLWIQILKENDLKNGTTLVSADQLHPRESEGGAAGIMEELNDLRRFLGQDQNEGASHAIKSHDEDYDDEDDERDRLIGVRSSIAIDVNDNILLLRSIYVSHGDITKHNCSIYPELLLFGPEYGFKKNITTVLPENATYHYECDTITQITSDISDVFTFFVSNKGVLFLTKKAEAVYLIAYFQYIRQEDELPPTVEEVYENVNETEATIQDEISDESDEDDDSDEDKLPDEKGTSDEQQSSIESSGNSTSNTEKSSGGTNENADAATDSDESNETSSKVVETDDSIDDDNGSDDEHQSNATASGQSAEATDGTYETETPEDTANGLNAITVNG